MQHSHLRLTLTRLNMSKAAHAHHIAYSNSYAVLAVMSFCDQFVSHVVCAYRMAELPINPETGEPEEAEAANEVLRLVPAFRDSQN